MKGENRKRAVLYNLEALRGLAALIVVLCHAPWMNSTFRLDAVSHGWAFVDFFFVLSGFVIALNYGHGMSATGAATSFMARRLYRLLPLHWVTLLACLTQDVVRNGALPLLLKIPARYPLGLGYWIDVLLSVVLLQGMGTTNFSLPNPPSWSISTEVFAYLTFALICRSIPRRWLPPAFVVLGFMAYVVLQWLQGWTGINGPLEFRFLRCLFAFSLGVIGCFVFLKFERFQADRIMLAAQFAGWGAVLYILSVIGEFDVLSSLLPPLFALIVVSAALDRGSLIKRLLETWPGRTAGKLSYSIYMVHAFVGNAVALFVNRFATGSVTINHITRLSLSPLWTVLSMTVYLGGTLALSSVTYRWIEAPWREKGRIATARWFGSKAVAPVKDIASTSLA